MSDFEIVKNYRIQSRYGVKDKKEITFEQFMSAHKRFKKELFRYLKSAEK